MALTVLFVPTLLDRGGAPLDLLEEVLEIEEDQRGGNTLKSFKD